MNTCLKFFIHNFASFPYYPSLARSTSRHNSKYIRMMECCILEEEELEVGRRLITWGVNMKDEDVNRFTGKMGFIVSDSNGNEVKLSKCIRMSSRRGCGMVDRRVRGLRKLAWDMNDGTLGELEDKKKKFRRVLSSKVKL